MGARVIKFGGTSLGDARRIARAADAVRAARTAGPVAVVVSAMAGVTNRLLALIDDLAGAPLAARQALVELLDEHRGVARELGIVEPVEAPWTLARLDERLHEALRSLAAGDTGARDLVLAGGEKLSAWLLLGALQARGVEAAIVPAEVLIRARRDEASVDVEIDTTRTSARVANDDGETDIALSAATPRQATAGTGEHVATLTSYTSIGGAWHSTLSQTNLLSAGTTRFPRGVNLQLGIGRMADDVRSLQPIRTIQLDVVTNGQLALHMPVPTSIQRVQA